MLVSRSMSDETDQAELEPAFDEVGIGNHDRCLVVQVVQLVEMNQQLAWGVLAQGFADSRMDFGSSACHGQSVIFEHVEEGAVRTGADGFAVYSGHRNRFLREGDFYFVCVDCSLGDQDFRSLAELQLLSLGGVCGPDCY